MSYDAVSAFVWVYALKAITVRSLVEKPRVGG